MYEVEHLWMALWVDEVVEVVSDLLLEDCYVVIEHNWVYFEYLCHV